MAELLYGIVRNGKAIGVSLEEYKEYVGEMEEKARLKGSVGS